MDILDLLVEDHGKLRRDLAGIKKVLAEEGVRDRLKRFISDYEMHESIEEEILFPRLDARTGHSLPADVVPAYEKMHGRVWILLEQLANALALNRPDEQQQAFLKFEASLDAHLDHEERLLFPAVRQALDRATLEKLGGKAARRLGRFAGI